MAKKDEEFQDLITGGSGNAYGDGSVDTFINRRKSIQRNKDDAKKSRKTAWRKRMKKLGYEVDGSDNAYTSSGKFVQSFEGSEKGEELQNQIRKIDVNAKEPEVKTEDKVLSSKEKLKSIVQRQADGEELTDDEWEGYLRDLAGEYRGVRMNTGEDATDDEIPRLEDTGVEETPTFQSDAEMKNFYDRKALNDQHNKETAILRNEQYLKTIGNNGVNDTYTSNYKEAIKADTGWKAFYDDSPDPNDPVRRSDVFTRAEADWGMYKKGDVLGVMGRSQRRAYDDAMHEAKINKQHQKYADEATGGSGVYGEKDKKGQGTLTEWTTDQEASEGGKVITGGESAKADVSEGSKTDIIYDPDKNRKKGGS